MGEFDHEPVTGTDVNEDEPKTDAEVQDAVEEGDSVRVGDTVEEVVESRGAATARAQAEHAATEGDE